MGFREKFSLIAIVLLTLPFIIILFSIRTGTSDCLDNIGKHIPNAIEGDMTKINEIKDTYCDPNSGKFLFAKKVGDLTKNIYKIYFWIAVILSAIIAGIWEFKEGSY
ncbi:hypothetical protein BMS3Abin16_01259 [archaeon BMS3Abin16]|nr:hypothetical protein BMS3Abin16_01259 [archaeon BMS3Abin16]GBE56539.1 hypothetical protein BMS3Bbin16_00748 [archaeon BMS3Bbin16]HDY73816.1 hypothetical protein [Euryarchaeota archaeon]